VNHYVLGLDIGITSVGWGIIDKECNVIDTGVRLFEEADTSNNETRRDKRGWRRVKRRRQQRVIEMRRLLARKGIVSKDFTPLPNPYELREKGLRRTLTEEELATALLHLVKRRGSTLDIEDVALDEKDEKKAKDNLAENTRLLENEGRHVVEVQLERYRERGQIRGTDNIFKTDAYVAEARAILKKQGFDTPFIEEVVELIERKRHYSEGPGSKDSPTPYGRWRHDEEGNLIKVDLIEAMRGTCSVYPEEKRAPLKSFSAELFNFLNDLNNLKIPGEQEKLSETQKKEIFGEIRKKGYLTPKTDQPEGLARVLDIDKDLISGFRVDDKGKPILTTFPGYEALLKAYKKAGFNAAEEHIEQLDRIADILSVKKLPSERREALLEEGFDANLVESLKQLPSFDQYHSMSFKALREINEEMFKTSKNQMEIITEQGLNQKEVPDKLTLNEDAILSPVAKRAHREALRVVENLIHKYGDFEKIVIETTREKNSRDQRDNIRRAQRMNRERKEQVKELVKDSYGEDYAERIKGGRALKLRLYKEQDGKCAYTYNALDLNSIVEGRDPYEIDHIIPYSISLDDSFNNKVLCEARANQLKGNRSPHAYFKSGSAYGSVKDFETFKQKVQSNKNYHPKKKELLLREDNITKYDTLKEFIERNLVDTSYATRTLMNTLQDYFKAHGKPTSVLTIKGKVTNLFRNIGASQFFKDHPHADENPLEKDRNIFKHHAIDALIAARLSEQRLIRDLFRVEHSKEIDRETGEILYKKSPKEDENLIRFVKHLADFDTDHFKYSWKVDKKPNRAFSDETIYSTRPSEDEKSEYVVKKYPDIYALTNDKLEKIFEKDKGENLLVYHHDPRTYSKLEDVYHHYKHEKYPFAAYKEEHGPITKYAKKGNGPPVRQLKYYDGKLGSHVDISHKYDPKGKRVVLQQISPYRTDFYRNPDGRIKFVTIRYSEMQPEDDAFVIPVSEYEQKKQVKEIEDNAEFIASFNRNEIIEIINQDKKQGEVRERYRFIATNSDTDNRIEVKPIEHMSSKPRIMPTIGRKTKDVRKYAVSPIGEMAKVENEDLKLRVPFATM